MGPIGVINGTRMWDGSNSPELSVDLASGGPNTIAAVLPRRWVL